MRITLQEAEHIVRSAHTVFGRDSHVILFGSRVDDAAQGGDIDLYIQTSDHSDLFEKKLRYLQMLEEVLGEQKIDVVFNKDTAGRIVEQEALEKGIPLNIDQIKLTKYFNEREKHIQRINEAYEDMREIIPLTVERYKNLTKDQVQDIDQYIFRFSKLQDTMGDKLFRLVLQRYEETDAPLPFMDILNKLEKYGCISSAKEWAYLRKLRNEIAHQYDDEAEEMTQAINALLTQKEIIIDIYAKLKACVQANITFPPPQR